MRIAQISNNTIPVPPKDYGGTQREVYYLTEELLRRGHKVYLFAKKGTSARSTKTFYYPSNDAKEQLAFIKKNLPDGIDFIHDHYGIVAKANPPIPTIRSSHSKGVTGVQIPVYVSKKIWSKYGDRKGFFVHNGIRMKDYTFRKKKKKHLLFLGRIMKEKGTHLAVKVAKKTGKDLILAGPIHDNKYFKSKIQPHLNKHIRYVGPVGGKKKQQLLSEASCVLFTSTWDEPFGLVLIEAMACGTPALGFKKGGAVPEVLKGMPALICKNTKSMIAKAKHPKKLPSARACRRYVKTNFSDRAMTSKFLKLYKKIIMEKQYKLNKQSTWNEI
ncbi:glycosyltransferase involved in cell wall biosynthesis [Paenibacillus endophyticus]|uniref:Glycosyltransferase involved in cell wall biosynthesis n=1 Tax=Paenibacillus endophyticus TaxID=1294268 RepID=A0A7W5CC53_9BACL|nr:glycosyltransferase [Paenibacillus endophyticus]MBB3154970.1 glycosyltransferase involved in cell wall biosynthesis [Paenibacillus endophyticus]